jgi:hypothetical protein
MMGDDSGSGTKQIRDQATDRVPIRPAAKS